MTDILSVLKIYNEVF